MGQAVTDVVFDLGGVLIDWNPRYLYLELFDGDELAMEDFLREVCTPAWNDKQDSGRSFKDAGAELKLQFPDKNKLIDAWLPGFDKMMRGSIPGSVDILSELCNAQVPLYALTNWSAETFPIALNRFDFLSWFDGIIVSGQEKIAKPDPRLFQLLLSRFDLAPTSTLFIDDNVANIESARRLGFDTFLFTDSLALRSKLSHLNLLPLQRYAS